MKVVLATQIKCALACAFVSLALVSQTSAVLRPLFPIKPVAPTNGEVIVIGDELVLQSARKPLLHHWGRQGSQRLDSRVRRSRWASPALSST